MSSNEEGGQSARERWKSPTGISAIAGLAGSVAAIAALVIGSRAGSSDPTSGSTGSSVVTADKSTPTKRVERGLRYDDALDSLKRGWRVGKTPVCNYASTSNGYQISSLGEGNCGSITTFDARLTALRDTRTEVQAALVEPPTGPDPALQSAGMGLACRTGGAYSNSSSYTSTIGADGTILLVRYAQGPEQVTLIDQSNPLARSSIGQWRRLRFDCVQGAENVVTLTAWIDGTKLFSYADRDALGVGAVGLVAVANGPVTVGTVVFRNLSIRSGQLG